VRAAWDRSPHCSRPRAGAGVALARESVWAPWARGWGGAGVRRFARDFAFLFETGEPRRTWIEFVGLGRRWRRLGSS